MCKVRLNESYFGCSHTKPFLAARVTEFADLCSLSLSPSQHSRRGLSLYALLITNIVILDLECSNVIALVPAKP